MLQLKETHHNDLPLCVDLDGTLILTDMLAESLVRVLRRKPWILFALPVWLFRGKRYLKARLAEQSSIAFDSLPYHDPFLSYLKEQKRQGRRLILVTGAHEILAQKVAEHINIFSDVIATNEQGNMVGKTKAARLVKEFGAKQFDYAGNEKTDLHIWRQARRAILVNCRSSVERQVKKLPNVEVELIIRRHRITPKLLIKGMRVHQWSKNGLILVPMFAAHKAFELETWGITLMAFASFCFMASATYIINDLCDLDADRKHPTKSKRPFASGRLSILQGLVMLTTLGVGALMFLPFLPWQFSVVFSMYLVGTLTYTFMFKTVAIFDVVILASLFTIRVVAGGVAIGVELSFWLMSFSVFMFLSLAMVKRVSELINLSQTSEAWVAGRGYQVEDLSILKSMGVCSSFLAVLVFALYINSPEVAKMYGEPRLLWLICPFLLYWVADIWLVTARGKMNEDPVFYALKDFKSWIVYLGIGFVYVAAMMIGTG